jgi:hypothetical protein
MTISRLLKVTLFSFLISGCASNVIPTFTSSPDYSQLYLRGVFTWWEADEKYKLVEVSEDKFATEIRLIADGQPYDFRFADVNWSPELNCGYARVNLDQIVKLGISVKANCQSQDENFRFTPRDTGLYQFSIDFTEPNIPEVEIKLISN